MIRKPGVNLLEAYSKAIRKEIDSTRKGCTFLHSLKRFLGLDYNAIFLDSRGYFKGEEFKDERELESKLAGMKSKGLRLFSHGLSGRRMRKRVDQNNDIVDEERASGKLSYPFSFGSGNHFFN